MYRRHKNAENEGGGGPKRAQGHVVFSCCASRDAFDRYAITLFFEPRASGELTLAALRFPWYGWPRAADLRARAGESTDGIRSTLAAGSWQRAARLAGGVLAARLLGCLIWRIQGMARWRLARRGPA